MSKFIKHFWECECGKTVDFRTPELPPGNHRSEQNEDKSCPECNDEMYFDEYEVHDNLVPPPKEG